MDYMTTFSTLSWVTSYLFERPPVTQDTWVTTWVKLGLIGGTSWVTWVTTPNNIRLGLRPYVYIIDVTQVRIST